VNAPFAFQVLNSDLANHLEGSIHSSHQSSIRECSPVKFQKRDRYWLTMRTVLGGTPHRRKAFLRTCHEQC
jgi:hypothetical protein